MQSQLAGGTSLMVGHSTGTAPRACRCRMISADCSKARVTSIRRPCRGLVGDFTLIDILQNRLATGCQQAVSQRYAQGCGIGC